LKNHGLLYKLNVEIDFYSGDDPDRDSKVWAQNGFGSCNGVIPSTVRPFYI
jgi:hypothetical protein